MEDKLIKFAELCGDWDYRNIDMTQPHISGIYLLEGKLLISCELFSPEVDDYVSCDGGSFKDETLINNFKKLNLNRRKDVLEFISSLNDLVDWHKVGINLEKEVEIELKNIDYIEDNCEEMDDEIRLF